MVNTIMVLVDITHWQLLKARKMLGVTQIEVAKATSLSHSSYVGIETGKTDPKLSNYRKVVKFYIDSGVIFENEEKVKLINK